MTKLKKIHADFSLNKCPEWGLDGTQKEQIHQLLTHVFPGYPENKIFIKQMPSLRFLGYWQENILVAHAALDLRVINNGGQLRQVIAIGDFCIHTDYQGKQIGAYLLEQIIDFGKEVNFDFIMAISGEPGFYENSGFEMKDTVCRWMIISGDRSLGLAQRLLKDSLFVYPLKQDGIWLNAPTDFMGSVF